MQEGASRADLRQSWSSGYSRLFPGDEQENFTELRALLTDVIEPQIAEFGGNIFKETAELVLAEFAGVARGRALRGRAA